MQRRLKNSFPGEAEFLIDKEISGIIGGGESCNSERHRRMLRIMRDIIEKVGETPRLRIGIGRPENMDLKDYVLSNIDAMSKEIFDNTFNDAIKKIEEFIYR